VRLWASAALTAFRRVWMIKQSASHICSGSTRAGRKGRNYGRIREGALGFMKERKTFWLLPIIVTLVLLGGLMAVTFGSAAAPSIYTLF
jgi:hypothetical protein